MKTTFRMVGMMLIAVLFSVGLASCSSDDDDEPADPSTHDPALVGTWVNTNSDSDWTETEVLKFSANGKFEAKFTYEDSEEKFAFKYGGLWSTSANKLKGEITYSDDSEEVEIGSVQVSEYSISGDKLYIEGMVYTRK